MSHLEKFSYYFNVEGKTGGLFSLSFEFQPDKGEPETWREAAQSDFSKFEAMLDKFVQGNPTIRSEKVPLLIDSPHSTQVGYKYKGRVKHPILIVWPIVNKYFKHFSTKPEVGSPMSGDVLSKLTATLLCQFRKGHDNDRKAATITLELALGHNLNLSILHEVMALPSLRLRAEARTELDNLQKILPFQGNVNPAYLIAWNL